MMKWKRLLFLVFLLSSSLTWAQTIHGKVTYKNADSTEAGAFVTIKWLGIGTGTSSDINGYYEIEHTGESDHLVFSAIGYHSDTIKVEEEQYELNVTLYQETSTLKATEIDNGPGSVHSKIKIQQTEVMLKGELRKAACCNLSEAFETNPSVDVSFTDAVTGAKQIQMLGLSGVYSPVLTESLPFTRGLATSFGLAYIPGTQVESIALSKGAGPVINGYESINGQINVNLKQPQETNRLFVNLYGSGFGRFEQNVDYRIKVSDKVSTLFMFHNENRFNKMDQNDDGFLDLPLINSSSALNRWKFGGDTIEGMVGFKILDEKRLGGQNSFNHDEDRGSASVYGLGINTRRVEAFGKIGYLHPTKMYKSFGLQLSAYQHEQDAYYGLNNYTGEEQNFYANFIYQSIIGNTQHSFRTGMSYMYSDYDEVLNDSNLTRTESVPGVFFEHTWKPTDRFSIVSGIRGDAHNLFGNFVTPRMHLKYNATSKLTLRASGGRGLRFANVLAENQAILASSRQIIFDETLEPEIAWNYGMNVNRTITAFGRQGDINLDFYRTTFENQVVYDRDQNVQEFHVYNLDGQSYANAYQAEIQVEPMWRLKVKAAYKFYDVKTTINNELRARPLVPRERAFMNVAYQYKKWEFDITEQWVGEQRLPDTKSNPLEYQVESETPSYFLTSAQVTYNYKSWAFYLGGENLTGYKLKNPIVASDAPFSKFFDSSFVWAPITGRMVYAGLRYDLK